MVACAEIIFLDVCIRNLINMKQESSLVFSILQIFILLYDIILWTIMMDQSAGGRNIIIIVVTILRTHPASKQLNTSIICLGRARLKWSNLEHDQMYLARRRMSRENTCHVVRIDASLIALVHEHWESPTALTLDILDTMLQLFLVGGGRVRTDEPATEVVPLFL